MQEQNTSERNKGININISIKKKRNFDAAAFLATSGLGRTILHLGNKEHAFPRVMLPTVCFIFRAAG